MTVRSRPRLLLGAALLAILAVGGRELWEGANSPHAGWFGALVSHGDRHRPLVALTFDDGPNVTTTLGVRDLLDARGVKGTFFSVGKAVDAQPGVSRALVDHGHLVENHSYLHDSVRWLDPRYPELARADRAIVRRVGVCPAFFRPPHGQHTPFMARAVRRRKMTMVTWDVSAGDWKAHDAAKLAREILHKLRPGSIIDLHDGLDGDVVTDRTVVLRALPLILDGMQARGLKAVRLDALLGKPGYRARCGAPATPPGG